MAPKRKRAAAAEDEVEVEVPRKQLEETKRELERKEQELENQKTQKEVAHSQLEKTRKAWDCPICLSACLSFRDPVFLAPCSHIFCRECIDTASAAAGPALSASCPVCLAPFKKDAIRGLKKGIPFAYRQLLSLFIECPLECSWKGEVGDLDTHFDSCVKAKCQEAGCRQLPGTMQVR